jgi:hypothetical protein
MPTLSQISCLLVGFCLITAGMPLPGAAASFDASTTADRLRVANAQQQQTTKKPNAETTAKPKADVDEADDSQDEPVDEECRRPTATLLHFHERRIYRQVKR